MFPIRESIQKVLFDGIFFENLKDLDIFRVNFFFIMVYKDLKERFTKKDNLKKEQSQILFFFFLIETICIIFLVQTSELFVFVGKGRNTEQFSH